MSNEVDALVKNHKPLTPTQKNAIWDEVAKRSAHDKPIVVASNPELRPDFDAHRHTVITETKQALFNMLERNYQVTAMDSELWEIIHIVNDGFSQIPDGTLANHYGDQSYSGVLDTVTRAQAST